MDIESSILKIITDRIKKEQVENFAAFKKADFPLRERTRPLNIIKVLKENFTLIAEVKKGSPSRGIIKQHFDPLKIARMYEEGGAHAVSVITEEIFFYGKKEYLSLIKKNIKIPVLRKDFIIHPYMVYEAYNLGADFILLIAACLSDENLERLYNFSLELGMQVLMEAHSSEELQRVLKIKPEIIGINNRDLNSFKVDLKTSFLLKGELDSWIKDIKYKPFIISESGIRDGEDIVKLKNAGFNGVLIGESLLKVKDVKGSLRQWLK